MRVAAVTAAAAVAADGNANSGCYFFEQSAQKDGTGLAKLAGRSSSPPLPHHTQTKQNLLWVAVPANSLGRTNKNFSYILERHKKSKEWESGNMRSMPG